MSAIAGSLIGCTIMAACCAWLERRARRARLASLAVDDWIGLPDDPGAWCIVSHLLDNGATAGSRYGIEFESLDTRGSVPHGRVRVWSLDTGGSVARFDVSHEYEERL